MRAAISELKAFLKRDLQDYQLADYLMLSQKSRLLLLAIAGIILMVLTLWLWHGVLKTPSNAKSQLAMQQQEIGLLHTEIAAKEDLIKMPAFREVFELQQEQQSAGNPQLMRFMVDIRTQMNALKIPTLSSIPSQEWVVLDLNQLPSSSSSALFNHPFKMVDQREDSIPRLRVDLILEGHPGIILMALNRLTAQRDYWIQVENWQSQTTDHRLIHEITLQTYPLTTLMEAFTQVLSTEEASVDEYALLQSVIGLSAEEIRKRLENDMSIMAQKVHSNSHIIGTYHKFPFQMPVIDSDPLEASQVRDSSTPITVWRIGEQYQGVLLSGIVRFHSDISDDENMGKAVVMMPDGTLSVMTEKSLNARFTVHDEWVEIEE